MDRRIVVTGLGTVNASTAGGRDALAGALALGRSAIGPVRAFDATAMVSRLAAEVDEVTLASLVDRDAARRLSRICRLALAACLLAVRDAGIAGGPGLGIVVGTEHGDFTSSRDFAQGFLRRGPAGLSPMVFPNTVMNTMASIAAIAIGAKAPSITVNQATLAGDLAVARGARLVVDRRAEAVVAGGVDELFHDVYQRLAEMGALSPMRSHAPEGCRPFAVDHNGPVLGEGATFIVLEEREAARARGARIMAEIVEVAWGNVPTAPHTGRAVRADHGSPVARMIRGRDPELVARCYGSGNGDPVVDDWERALLGRDLPGAGADLLPPVSLAPLFGQHGGLGALRVGAAALDAERGTPSVLVHGIARGGCRTAVLVGPAP
ncbi:MAG TPA: beta-ketoacyl synthase N-terminal-like domain-containing protein [Methylomirabilota bacterium]|jgi:Beta-ketoacyl synthase, N-terminal domain|nr:beta-ketoacyl synthase N-terminal-like domain-containing protein [Methylomirabilota bacterium]